MDNQKPFSEGTKLCAAILLGLQNTEEGGYLCQLPGGEEVNFYQVIPLYREELAYKLEHDVEALLEKMAEVNFVVYLDRPNSIAG